MGLIISIYKFEYQLSTCGVENLVLMNTVSFKNWRNNYHVVLFSKLRRKQTKTFQTNIIRAGVSIKFEVGSWFEYSNRLYEQGFETVFL